VKVEGKIEGTRRRGRRPKKVLDDVQEKDQGLELERGNNYIALFGQVALEELMDLSQDGLRYEHEGYCYKPYLKTLSLCKTDWMQPYAVCALCLSHLVTTLRHVSRVHQDVLRDLLFLPHKILR
jgi:hypothetical protein